jgi:hypothetical protein
VLLSEQQNECANHQLPHQAAWQKNEPQQTVLHAGNMGE